MLVARLALIASLTALAAAQEITWAEGASPSDLTVYAVPEGRPSSSPRVVASRVEFVDLEVTNRTAGQALRTDVARRVERGGLASVELPAGGQLFAYRRDGGRVWGYLWVERSGVAHLVLERPGVGAGGLDSPFADRIGVAPDGLHGAVPLVDGSVWIVRLDGGRYAGGAFARNAGLPVPVEVTTICPGRSVLFCGTDDDRVFRIPFAAGAPAQAVTPAGPTGARLKSEFAPAADGRSVVFLHGPQRLFTLYRLGESGPAVPLPPPAAKYEEPGYLPETAGGPRLMLDDAGGNLLYVDSTLRDETYLLDLASGSTVHVTGDSNFQPYIGVIILPVALGSTVALAVGDPGRFDVYATSAANPVVANLTTTAGNTTRPWASGGLVPRSLVPTGDGRLVVEAQPSAGGPGDLLRLGAGGPVVLATGTLGAPVRGSGFGVDADLLIATVGGPRLLAGHDAGLLAVAPAGVALSTSVVAPADAWRVLLAAIPGVRALVFRLPGGAMIALPASSATDEVAVTAGGGLCVDGARLSFFDATGAATLGSPSAYRRVLSGRSASL